MSKKILFFSLFILISLISWKQNSNAKTWKNTKVPADSILAAIDRGDSVIIISCEIDSPLIKEGTWERRDTIENLITISHSTFSDIVSFRYCYFVNHVQFWFDSFRTVAIFDHATFGGFANFWYTTFGGEVSFEYATFDTNASFISATFDTNAYFKEAAFRGWAYFQEDSFSGDVSFSGAAFGGQVSFRTTTFGKHANFTGAIFPKYACFIRATFDTVSFDRTKFGGGVDLRGMQFKDINIRWNQLEGCLYCDNLTSYKLMKNFEEKRMVNDADGVYLFLKDHERMEKHWYVRYPEYWFVYLTCGYGTKPLNTLILSVILVFLFAFFYTRENAIQEIPKEVGYRRKRRLHQDIPKRFWKKLWKKFYHPLYFSLHTFIIGVVSDWHPADEYLKITIRKKKIKLIRFRSLAMIEGTLGWILVIILIISLERTIGR